MLDIVLLVILILGFSWGCYKGFFLQLASLVGAVVGFIVAGIVYAKWGDALVPDGAGLTTNLLIFVVLWLGIPFALTFVAKLLGNILSVLHLGWVNRLAGGVLGLIKVGLFLSLFLTAYDFLSKYDKNPMVNDQAKESSVLYYPIRNQVSYLLPEHFIDKVMEKSGLE